MGDLKEFWQRLQSGVEVAVANPEPEKLLGVRDGFLRFFRDARGRSISIAVVPQKGDAPTSGLPLGDEEIVNLGRREAEALEARLGASYHFYLASEAGLSALEIDGRTHYFVRNWTVLRTRLGEAWGASGAIELPERILDGLDGEEMRYGVPGVPGTRKGGGLIRALSGGLETRRQAVELATVHALSTLFYGRLDRSRGTSARS